MASLDMFQRNFPRSSTDSCPLVIVSIRVHPLTPLTLSSTIFTRSPQCTRRARYDVALDKFQPTAGVWVFEVEVQRKVLSGPQTMGLLTSHVLVHGPDTPDDIIAQFYQVLCFLLLIFLIV